MGTSGEAATGTGEGSGEWTVRKEKKYNSNVKDK